MKTERDKSRSAEWSNLAEYILIVADKVRRERGFTKEDRTPLTTFSWHFWGAEWRWKSVPATILQTTREGGIPPRGLLVWFGNVQEVRDSANPQQTANELTLGFLKGLGFLPDEDTITGIVQKNIAVIRSLRPTPRFDGSRTTELRVSHTKFPFVATIYLLNIGEYIRSRSEPLTDGFSISYSDK